VRPPCSPKVDCFWSEGLRRHSLELTASPLATVTVLDHDAADERGAKAHFIALPYLYHGVKPLPKKRQAQSALARFAIPDSLVSGPNMPHAGILILRIKRATLHRIPRYISTTVLGSSPPNSSVMATFSSTSGPAPAHAKRKPRTLILCFDGTGNEYTTAVCAFPPPLLWRYNHCAAVLSHRTQMWSSCILFLIKIRWRTSCATIK
jgi:hypothetical protein